GGKNGFGSSFYDDLWALSLGATPTWSVVNPLRAHPPARFSHTAIYDPVRDRMIVYAGAYWGGQYGDLWTLSLSGTPTWSEIVPHGTLPPIRYNHSAIYDPVRDRMLVFGGYLSGDNGVWAL